VVLRYHLLPRHDGIALRLEPHHGAFVSGSHRRPLERAASGPSALRIGAAKAFGANVAIVMRNAATNVQELGTQRTGRASNAWRE